MTIKAELDSIAEKLYEDRNYYTDARLFRCAIEKAYSLGKEHSKAGEAALAKLTDYDKKVLGLT